MVVPFCELTVLFVQAKSGSIPSRDSLTAERDNYTILTADCKTGSGPKDSDEPKRRLEAAPGSTDPKSPSSRTIFSLA
jgi:hypothetical protein